MTGRVRIRIIGSEGQVKHDYTINNSIQSVVREALAAKVRDNTPFPDEYVPNFFSVTSSQMETVYPRIQSRHAMSDGGMYFFAITEFSQGDDETYVYAVGLLNSVYWPIAGAMGSGIDGVFFNPSDRIEVAYMINLSANDQAGGSTVFTSYFQDLSAVMLGQRNIIDFEADNSQYLVPNQAVLHSEDISQMGIKSFVPTGADSFIGTSEGDLEWDASASDGETVPFYVYWESKPPGMSNTKIIASTSLNQELRDAYPQGTNIETRFSIELTS